MGPPRYLSEFADMPAPVYPGLSDEEKIRRLMQGRPLLPVEYDDLVQRGPAPPMEAIPPGRQMTPADIQPLRRQMSPAEQQALYSQKGMQPQLLPTSLWDLAVNNPVSEYIGEALGAAGRSLSELTSSPLAPLALPFLVGTVVNKAGRSVPGIESDTGRYLPAPASIRREADRLLTLGELTEPQALRQAEDKLRWQEWERPRLEMPREQGGRGYGPLRPATFPATKRRLQQNTDAAVDARIRRVLDYLETPPGEVWRPTDYGIFDRGLIKDAMEGFPDVPQSTFPRSTPIKGDARYVSEMYEDPRNRDLIKRQIARGLPQGGETFYPSLWPIKHEWMSQGGSPQQYDKWVNATSPGSIRNSLPNEQAVGNFLMMLHYQGIPLTEQNITRAMDAFQSRFGSRMPLMYSTHGKAVAKVLEQGISPQDVMEQNLTDSYKVGSYSANKRGDIMNVFTGDVHESRGGTFGSRYHPYFAEQEGFDKYQYGPAEAGMRDISREMGLPTATGQAGRWFGGGRLTDLLSEPGDALNHIEKQAAYTLFRMGRPTDPVSVRNYVMELIRQGGIMAPWGKTDEFMPDVRSFAPGSARPSRR